MIDFIRFPGWRRHGKDSDRHLPLAPATTVTSCLPISILDLLHQRVVEAPRIELKGSWNEGPTGRQVVRTVSAFANDFHNLNGGYIVIGVEERDGAAVLPPKGLDPTAIEGIQKWIRGHCRQLDPEYQPILSPEVVNDRHVLVVWAPASETRPHSAPTLRGGKDREYYVRLGAETVAASRQVLTDLMRMAGTVPFDDRRAIEFTVDDLRGRLVREFLKELGSRLLDERDDLELYRRMRLTVRVNGHELPRNVALMFFSDDPERAFRGARTEVVHFAEEGDVLHEHVFRGPLHHQARECLRFLKSRNALHIRKLPDRPETDNWQDYPFPALEEAVVNAIYHRSYERDMPEPIKVYIYPDRIAVTSYPGPMPGLLPKHFESDTPPPLTTARNRRIGELLKELRMAEARGTGVRKIRRAMAANGSPAPEFQFDEERNYFTVVLPIHPEAAAPVAVEAPASNGQDGLILIAVGSESIRPTVESSLEGSDLRHARILVDFADADYVEPGSRNWEAVARRVKNAVKRCLEQPGVERLHLFYHGPLAIAPLLGALTASSTKPTRVYHYEQGRYEPAYTIDRRFLIARD